MTATTDTLPYGTASTVRTCHYGADLKYGASVVKCIGEDDMKQIVLQHKTLKIRTCADCPIMHDRVCCLREKRMDGLTIPSNCPLMEAG